MKCWGEMERDEVTEQLAFQGYVKVSDALAQGDHGAVELAMNQNLPPCILLDLGPPARAELNNSLRTRRWSVPRTVLISR
jgi:hypothetical protein